MERAAAAVVLGLGCLPLLPLLLLLLTAAMGGCCIILELGCDG